MRQQSDFLHFAASISDAGAGPGTIIDYSTCARELIDNGYSIIKLPVLLQAQFWETLDLYGEVGTAEKSAFSFPAETDGFLPFGMEYAKSTNQIDLCERYCYWHRNRHHHEAHVFSRAAFYRTIGAYEAGISRVARGILDTICGQFEVPSDIEIRDSSYLQFCAYQKQYRTSDREYLQDRHEDGHLITFIKGNRDGLVIFPQGRRRVVQLADDEIIVITGSLLTLLSDGRIPYMDHAVLNPSVPVARSSLVYFVVPDLQRQYTSFIKREPLDLESFANESHEAFGNRPFTDSANDAPLIA
ncbi:2OG-Fe(II) oxygenase family protein [Burkholderia sp. A1]|uniref:2OG-Fe(II) oxygenase family protein n=1 Tax=Burkholderia sp. A1 TaxID=148446 RepID=UPI000A5D6F78|nr:2OG-Fe(II) oxygenase family protein [Burkholderia sp. A1]